MRILLFFFFNDTATTEIYTLSLHDALPISDRRPPPGGGWRTRARACRAGERPAASCPRGACPVAPPTPRRSRARGSSPAPSKVRVAVQGVVVDDADHHVLVGDVRAHGQIAHAATARDDHPVARPRVQAVDRDHQPIRVAAGRELGPHQQELAPAKPLRLPCRPEPTHDAAKQHDGSLASGASWRVSSRRAPAWPPASSPPASPPWSREV